MELLFFTGGPGRSNFPQGPKQRKQAQGKVTGKEAGPEGKKGRKRKLQRACKKARRLEARPAVSGRSAVSSQLMVAAM